MEFCTCSFRWNSYGWAKAIILWNFVLSAALGVQRLALQVGLGGLLPGAGCPRCRRRRRRRCCCL
jgi:hypothetical protein